MTHKLDKASAETLDETNKESVNLAQLLTCVFVVRKISEFVLFTHVMFKLFVSTKHAWVCMWSIS